jgi:hypothetical protein
LGRNRSNRQFNICPDPIAAVRDLVLYQRYRFDRAELLYLEEMLREDLKRETQRSNLLTTMEQILVALRFNASGSFQMV